LLLSLGIQWATKKQFLKKWIKKVITYMEHIRKDLGKIVICVSKMILHQRHHWKITKDLNILWQVTWYLGLRMSWEYDGEKI
jgi:hypothetical protein